MEEFYCTCDSFNYAGYPCKHMFACMIQISKENTFYDIHIDAFELTKRVRTYLSPSEVFTEFMNNQDFPVTIGYSAFKEKIMKKLPKKQ
jgi:hypothetical protein